MAVDKNSKAYQSLQKSGYTDDQITQMHGQVAEGENARDVIASTPASNRNENQQSSMMMTDPIAYRPEYNNGKYDKYIEWRDPTKLNNADINISQYWDDSSAKNYNNSALWWGENQKYTGENTLGSQIAYNPNATLAWLDPNYLYWQAAQMQNSKDANYIARRNDEIASALYNEWKVTVQDVANFLSQQNQWDYSNENERQNTIMSVWKRIGQIAEQNKKEEPASPEEPETNEPLENMKSDLLKSTAWELYGKVTADENTRIQTLEDENSVYRAMSESRITAFKNLQTASSDWLAAAIVSGSMATDSQQMRDLMQYDPAKYQEIQTAVKKLRWQMNINAITSGSGDFNTAATNGQSGINNEIVDFANSNSSTTSSTDILKSINQTLSSNVDAASASETMSNIENDMATLQNRLKNLKREASTVFKWDVPQYIVNAYIANRTAEIQDQLSILENRYNAAYSRYQDEVKQAQRQMEFDLKKEELQLKKDAAALDIWATQQWVALDWAKLWAATSTTSSTTVSWWTVQTTSLSREEIWASIDSLVEACTNWKLWNAQCATWIQKYYLPTLWVDLWSLSAYSAKKGICNWLAWEYTPQKWDLVVMSSSSKPENWHIGIVIWVEWDTLKYMDWNGSLDSNGNWTETAAIRTTKLSNSKIYGYYDPTKWQSKSSGWNWYYNPNYAEIYGKFLQWKYSAWKQLETTAQALWITIDELRNQANARKNDQNNSQDVTTRLDAIARLINTAWNNRTGRLLSDYSLPKFLFSWYSDFDAAYNFVRDNITFDKLLELKRWGATFWALSDNELRAIWNAAANLNKNMSNEEFQRQLTWIYNELLRGIGESSMTTSQIHDAFNTKLYTPSMQSSAWNTNRSWQSSQWNTNRNQSSQWMSAEEKARRLQWL